MNSPVVAQLFHENKPFSYSVGNPLASMGIFEIFSVVTQLTHHSSVSLDWKAQNKSSGTSLEAESFRRLSTTFSPIPF